jgi:hypothetical protein
MSARDFRRTGAAAAEEDVVEAASSPGHSRVSLDGQGDDKLRSFPQLASRGDGTRVGLDDLAADGQPDACAGVFVPTVEDLKKVEDPVEILGINADPVVFDRDFVSATTTIQPHFSATDHNFRRDPGSAEL